MKAVAQVFAGSNRDKDKKQPWCAVGSVKSMIGHTQAASGIAGLIKIALALHHKTLPRTLHFSTPNSQINWDESPCYVITETLPWTAPEHSDEPNQPRRAAVSAFGFGGINAHAILEEYANSSGARSLQPQQNEAGTVTPGKVKTGLVNLSLSYPALTAQSLRGLQLRTMHKSAQDIVQVPFTASTVPTNLSPDVRAALPGNLRSAASVGATSSEQKSSTSPEQQPIFADQNTVLCAYIQTMRAFHQKALGVQEKVMMSYLKVESEQVADLSIPPKSK